MPRKLSSRSHRRRFLSRLSRRLTRRPARPRCRSCRIRFQVGLSSGSRSRMGRCGGSDLALTLTLSLRTWSRGGSRSGVGRLRWRCLSWRTRRTNSLRCTGSRSGITRRGTPYSSSLNGGLRSLRIRQRWSRLPVRRSSSCTPGCCCRCSPLTSLLNLLGPGDLDLFVSWPVGRKLNRRVDRVW